MRDKFIFSDNQTLANVSSTGVVATNYWDLQEFAVAAGQVIGWLHIHINSASFSGLTQGLDIELRTSDNTDIATGAQYLGTLKLTAAEVVAGARFCIGVCKANLKRYMAPWYKAVNTAATGNIAVEAYFSDQPDFNELRMQKKPA